MNTLPNSFKYAIIALLGAALFIPFLGGVHLFDWDEINFAECAREMIVTKDYIRAKIDFMPFWEKPPIFIWMQVLAMKMFGINEFSARFPNAIVGIATLISVFYVGRKVMNGKVAFWWVAMYIASWLPHFYFKSGIIDPTFNLFIFLAFFQVHLLHYDDKKPLHATLAGIFLGLAVLTKGPVAILVGLLSLGVYMVVQRRTLPFPKKYLWLTAISAALPFAGWLVAAIVVHGFEYARWFMTEFLTYQVRLFRTEDADHGGPFYYHFIILLIGCFPASPFLFQYFRNPHRSDSMHSKGFIKLMWVMFWVVLILFSIVKTKIVHYSSLCYFPLTFLAAVQLYRITEERQILKKSVLKTFIVVGAVFALLITLLPLVAMNKNAIAPLIDDPFARGNLQADVHWAWWECLPGVAYLGALVYVWAQLKKQNFKVFGTLVIVQVLAIQSSIFHFTPKIEAYSQRAALEFYESFKGQDVYIHSLDFKSYAVLFYAQKQPFAAKEYYDNGKVNEIWLMNGTTDKPAYFIGKIQDSAKYAAFTQFTQLGVKNGFVFYKKK